MSGKLSTELHQVLLSSFRDRASVDQFASTLAAAERSLELLTPILYLWGTGITGR